MKNLSYLFLFIFALGLLGFWGLPWWTLVLIGLVAGWWFRPTAGTGFLGGFLAGFLLWGALSIYLNWLNDGILAARIGILFQGVGSATLILVTGLFGGLLAGLAVLAGIYAREWAFPPKKGPYARRKRRR